MAYASIKYDNGEIKCEVSAEIVDIVEKQHFPLAFIVTDIVSGEVVWKTELMPGMWASFPSARDHKAVLATRFYRVLKEFQYSYEMEDLLLYEFWDYFIRTHPYSHGLIVGAGDGKWGEWVRPVKEKEVQCHLVEASIKTYSELRETYRHMTHCKLHCEIVTADGEPCAFYEGTHDDGLNTVNLDYLKKLDPSTEDHHEVRQTISIDDLMERVGKVEWIRFDVEGIDYDLIVKMDKKHLEHLQMLQYEHYMLTDQHRAEVDEIFLSRGFRKLVYNIDTIYIK